jgi:hypothetical protein
MKMSLAVKDRAEAEHIRLALADPAVRAFVVTMGVLKALPSDKQRVRVLELVAEKLHLRDVAPVA